MLIQTTRFGMIEVDGSRIITFKEGLLGFPTHRHFALIQTSVDPVFFWMQSAEDPGLAFVVCDPLHFVPDYDVPVRQDDLDQLGLKRPEDCQVLVIVNKIEGELTANLLGPLLIGADTLWAKQMVLSDRRYSTRQSLLRLEPAAPAMALSA